MKLPVLEFTIAAVECVRETHDVTRVGLAPENGVNASPNREYVGGAASYTAIDVDGRRLEVDEEVALRLMRELAGVS